MSTSTTNNAVRPKAVVTGASSGIGEAFARALAARGYDLLLAARREDRLAKICAELSATSGAAAAYVVADLASDEGFAAFVARVRRDGPPDLLVNNAGFGAHACFEDVESDRSAAMIRLNVEAVVKGCREIGGDMLRRGRGAIVNTASTASFQPVPWFNVYSATKAFVLHFSESLHDEWYGRVHVMALCPGYTDTEFQGSSAMDGRFDRYPKMSAAAVVDEALRALDRKKSVCVTGSFNRFQVLLTRLLPRTVVRRAAGRLFRIAKK